MNELVFLQVIGLQVQVLLQLISVVGDPAMDDVFKAFKINSPADLVVVYRSSAVWRTQS